MKQPTGLEWVKLALEAREREKSSNVIKPENSNELHAATYRTKLQSLQNAVDPFPFSDSGENLELQRGSEQELSLLYTQKLQPYIYSPAKTDKCDCPDNDFVGHKLHINIESADVEAVSAYLMRENYWHKFLSGGEILDGKIFTLYIGSKDLTDKLAHKLSQDLKVSLKKPVEKDEIEYAPNVCGRFQGEKKDFHQYGLGLRGIPMTNDWARSLMYTEGDKRKEELPKAFESSYKTLSTNHGAYFYGTG